MDDTSAKENPDPDFNKLDLTQLQSFSFGTQWTQDKPDPAGRAGPRERRDDRPRRDGPPREGGNEMRRDRRAFRKPPVTTGPGETPAGGETSAPPGQGPSDRPPRRSGDFRGGPRREGPGGGERYQGGPRQYAPRGGQEPMRPPYESPFFNVAFYPEDVSFAALAKTIRASCRTLELFEIARTILGKNERFVAVVQRKAAPFGENLPPVGDTPPAKPAAAEKSAALYFSVPDGVPFETEEATIAHVLGKHLDKFFDLANVEIEPPKGNFQVVNRCTLTGELLGPPNYHRYSQIIQQHHAAHVARMPFERFRERIESVRDPELINQWLEKMKKATRYTWKQGRPAEVAKPAELAPAEPVPAEAAAPSSDPAAETPAQENAAPEAPPVETPAAIAIPAVSFDSLEEARAHLLTHARDKVLRAVEHARFHGKALETLPPGEIRRAVEGQLERQRRFPLDTANGLRGRLRREGFTIFKKGSKGVSYVCAVKRKFRVPGQVFADSIGTLISFIEAHPMIKAGELPEKFLGLSPAAPAAAAASTATEIPPIETPAAAAPALTPEQREKFSRLLGDLRWLVTEGYVTEFIDGRLFAPPPMAEARKKEVEATENDPENFPEVPAPEAAVAEPAAPAASPPPPEEVAPSG
ncbi:MAG TPA: hypothetical protein VK717_09660 [Opitutaceae bacterium]|jgi:hypothetical protein|nr:hypothetical protein [Opitutaceae bacterium]